MNCNIHPVLYRFYLHLKDTLGAEIVHRRKRTSNKAIEINCSSLPFILRNVAAGKRSSLRFVRLNQ